MTGATGYHAICGAYAAFHPDRWYSSLLLAVSVSCTTTFVLTSTKSVVHNGGMTPPRKRPTDAELAILGVLWSRGPSTVREVATVMGRERSYTTILKLLQIMTEKQLVRRNESTRSHVYDAARSEHDTQRHLVTDLADRAFGGSAAKLVMQALATKRTTRKELAEIRKLLDEQRGGRR